MKGKMTMLSQKYATALRKHLVPGSKDGLKRAADFGHRAAALGLEILQVAKIHEQALLPLLMPADSIGIRDGTISRAQVFFIEAITPIERTHLAAKAAQFQLHQLKETLAGRTDELTKSRDGINENVLQRKALEKSYKAKDGHYTKLLEESHLMQEELQYLAHQVLSAQEMERGKISRELHDEIAQAILGIHVRLLVLSQKSSSDFKNLLEEISAAQRLVGDAVQKMRRFAHKLPKLHEK
jgi:signal transduction histidine kinase